MIGSGIVSLPWTIQNSGIVLGIIICLIGVLISYRTCILIIRTAGNDNEYFDTLYKYWGPLGKNLGLISTLLIMIAAVCAYFIIMSQMLFQIMCALIEWISGTHIDPANTDFDLSSFSQTYAALIVFSVQVFVTMKRDLTVFIKLMSYGSYFIMALMLFIVAVGIYGFTNTNYIIEPSTVPISIIGEDRVLYLFNTNFSPLAG